MIVDLRSDRSRAGVSRCDPGVNLPIAASLLGLLAVSLWTVFETSSGALVLAWTSVWCFGTGVVGWYKRSWLWSGLCPAIMIALILLWAIIFGRTSWASTFVTMLGAMFAVAAAIGAVIGTWLGKRP